MGETLEYRRVSQVPRLELLQRSMALDDLSFLDLEDQRASSSPSSSSPLDLGFSLIVASLFSLLLVAPFANEVRRHYIEVLVVLGGKGC